MEMVVQEMKLFIFTHKTLVLILLLKAGKLHSQNVMVLVMVVFLQQWLECQMVVYLFLLLLFTCLLYTSDAADE